MTSNERQLRVLIVRLGAMGDLLHSLPAVTALRKAHPEWLLGWAVEPRWVSLLSAATTAEPMSKTPDMGHPRLSAYPDGGLPKMPVVDQVHLVAAKAWGRKPFSRETWAGMARVRRELRAAQYDVCLDLQGAVRSAAVGRMAGAKRMIGEARPREWAARFLFGERIPTQARHVIDQAIEVASAVTGETLTFTPAELPFDTAAEGWCEAWLAEHNIERFVLLNPGAGWGAKRWPAERYGLVAAGLASLGYDVVVNAGPREDALAAEVLATADQDLGQFAVKSRITAVSPTLPELIALTRRATLVIAGDTGPLHLANALGRPAVGIFGPTDPARNGPYGGNFRILRHPESKRDHARRDDPEEGLLTILPETVLKAVAELLAPQQPGQTGSAISDPAVSNQSTWVRN